MNFESFSQHMEKYKWQNRILVIESNSMDDIKYKSQISELKSNFSALSDRKLKIYSLFENGYATGFDQKVVPYENSVSKKAKSSFSVTLIGLDGGKKLVQNELLLCEKLFAIIDAMPMRRRELEMKRN